MFILGMTIVVIPNTMRRPVPDVEEYEPHDGKSIQGASKISTKTAFRSLSAGGSAIPLPWESFRHVTGRPCAISYLTNLRRSNHDRFLEMPEHVLFIDNPLNPPLEGGLTPIKILKAKDVTISFSIFQMFLLGMTMVVIPNTMLRPVPGVEEFEPRNRAQHSQYLKNIRAVSFFVPPSPAETLAQLGFFLRPPKFQRMKDFSFTIRA